MRKTRQEEVTPHVFASGAPELAALAIRAGRVQESRGAVVHVVNDKGQITMPALPKRCGSIED